MTTIITWVFFFFFGRKVAILVELEIFFYNLIELKKFFIREQGEPIVLRKFLFSKVGHIDGFMWTI